MCHEKIITLLKFLPRGMNCTTNTNIEKYLKTIRFKQFNKYKAVKYILGKKAI